MACSRSHPREPLTSLPRFVAWSTHSHVVSTDIIVSEQMCGSCANEGALKAAFMAYRARERGESGTQDFTPEEVRLYSVSAVKKANRNLTAFAFGTGS